MRSCVWVLNQFSIPSLHLIHRNTISIVKLLVGLMFSLMFVIIQMLLYHGIIRWEPNIRLDLFEIEILHSEIRVWTKIWHWSFVQENRAQKSAEGDEMCFIWIFSFYFGMRYYSMCLHKSMPCVIFEIRVFYKHIIFLWTLKGVFGWS